MARPDHRFKLANVLRAGSLASMASAITLMIAGRVECRDAAAPLNGPSQWLWGRTAPYRNGFSLKHTVVGYAIHHSASMIWGALYQLLGRRRPVSGAIATAAVAAFVDFRLTPQRFTPGFEHRLTKRSLVLAYAAFAAGLALSSRHAGAPVRGERTRGARSSRRPLVSSRQDRPGPGLHAEHRHRAARDREAQQGDSLGGRDLRALRLRPDPARHRSLRR